MKNRQTGRLVTGSMPETTLLPLLSIFWDRSGVFIISQAHTFHLSMPFQTSHLVLSTVSLDTTI